MKSGLRASWTWLLGLYTIASFLETVFWGQMTAFTPIFLRDLGLSQAQIPAMVGIIAAIVVAVMVARAARRRGPRQEAEPAPAAVPPTPKPHMRHRAAPDRQPIPRTQRPRRGHRSRPRA